MGRRPAGLSFIVVAVVLVVVGAGFSPVQATIERTGVVFHILDDSFFAVCALVLGVPLHSASRRSAGPGGNFLFPTVAELRPPPPKFSNLVPPLFSCSARFLSLSQDRIHIRTTMRGQWNQCNIRRVFITKNQRKPRYRGRRKQYNTKNTMERILSVAILAFRLSAIPCVSDGGLAA